MKFSSAMVIFLDPPTITSITPAQSISATLYEKLTFNCQAEGNPEPKYQWLQKVSTKKQQILIRSESPEMIVHNVTYQYQGDYVCKAFNIIKGKERSVQSSAVSVGVIGKGTNIQLSSPSREIFVIIYLGSCN